MLRVGSVTEAAVVMRHKEIEVFVSSGVAQVDRDIWLEFVLVTNLPCVFFPGCLIEAIIEELRHVSIRLLPGFVFGLEVKFKNFRKQLLLCCFGSKK